MVFIVHVCLQINKKTEVFIIIFWSNWSLLELQLGGSNSSHHVPCMNTGRRGRGPCKQNGGMEKKNINEAQVREKTVSMWLLNIRWKKIFNKSKRNKTTLCVWVQCEGNSLTLTFKPGQQQSLFWDISQKLNWHWNEVMRCTLRQTKNNFDSRSSLMSFPSLFETCWGNQPSKLFMSAVKVCSCSTSFPCSFNNVGNCLLALIYPSPWIASKQSGANWSQWVVAETLEADLEVDGCGVFRAATYKTSLLA